MSNNLLYPFEIYFKLLVLILLQLFNSVVFYFHAVLSQSKRIRRNVCKFSQSIFQVTVMYITVY